MDITWDGFLGDTKDDDPGCDMVLDGLINTLLSVISSFGRTTLTHLLYLVYHRLKQAIQHLVLRRHLLIILHIKTLCEPGIVIVIARINCLRSISFRRSLISDILLIKLFLTLCTQFKRFCSIKSIRAWLPSPDAESSATNTPSYGSWFFIIHFFEIYDINHREWRDPHIPHVVRHPTLPIESRTAWFPQNPAFSGLISLVGELDDDTGDVVIKFHILPALIHNLVARASWFFCWQILIIPGPIQLAQTFKLFLYLWIIKIHFLKALMLLQRRVNRLCLHVLFWRFRWQKHVVTFCGFYIRLLAQNIEILIAIHEKLRKTVPFRS